MLLLARPISEVPLAVVDVETTGLFAHSGDRVCEVAALRVEPGREPRMFSALVNPGRPIDAAASEVNGLRDADVAGAPPFSALIDELTANLEGAVLVAHNAKFDAAFLTAEYAIARVAPPDMPVLDTLLLARRQFQFRSNRLESLAREFGVPLSRQHRADADVTTLYSVLVRMLEHLERRGQRTVDQLIRAQGESVTLGTSVPSHLSGPLRLALQRGTSVTICYSDAGGRMTERQVDPLWVNNNYLIAFCRQRKAQRTFRLDRIQDAWLS